MKKEANQDMSVLMDNNNTFDDEIKNQSAHTWGFMILNNHNYCTFNCM